MVAALAPQLQPTRKRKETRGRARAGLPHSRLHLLPRAGATSSPLSALQSRVFSIRGLTVSGRASGKSFSTTTANYRLLVEQGGANTRARAKLQHEPLHVACLGNWGEVVRFLLSEGRVDVEAPDKNGMRCLHLAVQRNRLEAIRELLKHGCVGDLSCFSRSSGIPENRRNGILRKFQSTPARRTVKFTTQQLVCHERSEGEPFKVGLAIPFRGFKRILVL